MKAAWFGAPSSTAPSNSAVNYTYLVANPATAWNATEAGTTAGTYNVIPLSEDVTITKLTAWVTTAPGSGRSRSFTIRDDAADTAATVTISGTATTASWSGTAAIAAQSLVSMKTTPSGTPTAPGQIFWIIEYETGGDYYLMLAGCTVLTGTANMSGAGSGIATATTTAANEGQISTDATVTKIVVKVATAPGSGRSWTAYANHGTNSAFSALISNTATFAVSGAGAGLVIDSTRRLSVRMTASGTPATTMFSTCLTVVPANPGEVMWMFGNGVALATTNVTQYEVPSGAGAGGWNATESNVYARLPGCTLCKLFVRVGTAPGASKSRAFTLRSNAADTALSATITGASTVEANDTANTAAHSDGDFLSLKQVTTGSPAAATGSRAGFVMLIDQPSLVDPTDFFAMF